MASGEPKPIAFFSMARLPAALRHFRAHGHVGLSGVYARALGGASVAEFEEVAGAYEPSAVGEMKATIIDYQGSRERPNATATLAAIERCARQLGVTLWPGAPSWTSIIDIIRMIPGARGEGHRDTASLVEVVAISTVQGTSELLFEGGRSYALRPGRVVYHDPGMQLWHQGVAGPSGRRVGIVVAKEVGRHGGAP